MCGVRNERLRSQKTQSCDCRISLRDLDARGRSFRMLLKSLSSFVGPVLSGEGSGGDGRLLESSRFGVALRFPLSPFGSATLASPDRSSQRTDHD